MQADEIAALENGATDFVAKPYQPEIIRHRVASLIRLRETAAMANQFMYDRLTGLYAKEYFYERVRQVLEDNPENEYAILCCNLVNFKLYNDTFGRAEGDRLLKAEARLVREKVGRPPSAAAMRQTGFCVSSTVRPGVRWWSTFLLQAGGDLWDFSAASAS